LERKGKNWRGEGAKREEGEGGGKKRKRRGWKYDGEERGKSMLHFPYWQIKERLDLTLARQGELVEGRDGIRLYTKWGGEVWVTFLVGPDREIYALFWEVKRGQAHLVPNEVLFDDKVYHEGESWSEAAED
jgi:hypothetical protein